MHYPDLSPYRYLDHLNSYPRSRRVLNIGWLAAGYDGPTGSVPGLAEQLTGYVGYLPGMTLGDHDCEFCTNPLEDADGSIRVVCFGKTVSLGSAEIRIQGDGVWYASPNMVVHYVQKHNYLPPIEFVEAVFKCPAPDSQEYADALYELEYSRSPSWSVSAEIAAELYGTKLPRK